MANKMKKYELPHIVSCKMCEGYHLISHDTKYYDKNLYQKELIYRLNYQIVNNYIPKDSIYNSTWLFIYNGDIGHAMILYFIANRLYINNDYNIVGFKIDIKLALEKFENYKKSKLNIINLLINDFITNSIKIKFYNTDIINIDLLDNFKNKIKYLYKEDFIELMGKNLDEKLCNDIKDNAYSHANESFDYMINKFNIDRSVFDCITKLKKYTDIDKSKIFNKNYFNFNYFYYYCYYESYKKYQETYDYFYSKCMDELYENYFF